MKVKKVSICCLLCRKTAHELIWLFKIESEIRLFLLYLSILLKKSVASPNFTTFFTTFLSNISF